MGSGRVHEGPQPRQSARTIIRFLLPIACVQFLTHEFYRLPCDLQQTAIGGTGRRPSFRTCQARRITKQGNRYLRWLLVVGATAVIRYAQKHGTKDRPWLARLLD